MDTDAIVNAANEALLLLKQGRIEAAALRLAADGA